MRKGLALLVTAVLLNVTPISTEATDRPTGWRWRECRFQSVDGHRGWNVREVKRTIRCATLLFPTSLSTAMYVADRESNFYGNARNSYSGACGIFQHLPQYWPSRVNSLRNMHPNRGGYRGSCFNVRSNVMVAIHMAHHSGWGPWSM